MTKMTKCDFCDKPSIGYRSYQCAFYCEDHIEKAKEVETKMWEAMVEWDEHSEAKYWGEE